MDSQQTPRSPAELAAGQKPATVEQSPPLYQAGVSAGGLGAAAGTAGPRFPGPSNGPADGPPRLQQAGRGGAPGLRLAGPPDGRPQLNLQAGPLAPPPAQFPAARPPFPGQRAPPPRNAFFGRPGQPGAGPPARFPPPTGAYGQQGLLPRAAFPPAPTGTEPRFARPSPLPGDRTGPFRPQVSLDGRAELEGKQPGSRPASALSESGKNSDSEAESSKPETGQEPRSPVKAPAAEHYELKAKELKGQEPAVPEQSPLQPPPKTPTDATTIQGFDDGQRKSLKTPNSGSPASSFNDERDTSATNNKRTTFADQQKPDLRLVINSPSTTSLKADVENDSGVDESTQRIEVSKSNGVAGSPTKKSRDGDKRSMAGSPVKSPSKSIKSLPRTPDVTPSAASQDKKKVPMNKVQVGAAPSPNLKAVRSKIGSLDNTTYKPGGGKIKIENRKLDFSKAQPKITAKNDKYIPSGGDKKIQQVKLQWNAKPKIGSLDNTAYKPGGGDKKIETVKLDFKDKAKSKVGSKENAKHVPGGGAIKIETQKIDIKAESKIGSLGNVKHKPGGGDKKIFDDKTYLRQTSSSNIGSVSGSGSQSPIPSGAGSISDKNGLPISDENLNQEC